MKIILEFDSITEAMPALSALLGVEPAKPAPKRAKPVEVIAGNPDKPAPTLPIGAETAVIDKAALAAVVAAAEKPKTVTKAELSEVVEQAGKALGRAATVAVLEKFRPAGYTAEFVKLGAVDAANLGKLYADFMAAFTAAGKVFVPKEAA